MRFQCRIDGGRPAVLAAIPTFEPDAVPRCKTRVPRKASPLVRGAIAGAAMLAIAGCATFDGKVAQAWKIEPVFDVRHTMHSSEAYYALGKYFDGSRQWNKAIDAYRHAIAVDAGNVEAYNALGVALAQSGRLADAETTLRQAVALDASRGHVLSNLGFVLLLEGRVDEAITALKAAVDRDGNDATATSNLRLAMARSGAKATPVAAVDKAVQEAMPAKPAAPVAAEAATLKVGYGPAVVPSVTAPAKEVESVAEPVAARVEPSTPADVAPARVAAGPVAATPVEASPAAATPVEATPVAATPVEATPVAATPVEASPVEASPVAATPVETTPAEARQAEAGPIEAPPTLTPLLTPAASSSRLEISNGNGVTGMAARVGRWLARQGIATQRLTNQRPFAQPVTLVQYRAGHEEEAQRIARSMPAAAKADTQPTPGLRSDVRVVLGHDWVKAAACLSADSCTTDAGTVAMADR